MPHPQKKSKCAPAIWKKFTDNEMLLWQMFYEAFLRPEQYHVDWADKDSVKQREVTAHNHACQAVWSLISDVELEIRPI